MALDGHRYRRYVHDMCTFAWLPGKIQSIQRQSSGTSS